MWNCKGLSPPVFCELKVLLTAAQKDCLLVARNCLKKADRVLQDHSRLMSTELYVTKRIIYKLSSQFRTDKALHTLRQVHSCMKRLEEVDIGKQLSDMLLLFDRVSSEGDADVYLVSRQMLEYHLVKLQGTGALLRQTVQYSQKTFIHVRQHLELGNMIPQNMVLLALTSRIWYVCNSLCLYICEWYRKLYRCLTILKPTTVPWLHEGEVAVIEADLTDWLKQLIEDADLQEPDSEMVKCIEAERASGHAAFADGFDETLAHEDLGEPIQRDKSTVKRVDICIEQSEERLAKDKKGKKRKQERETFPHAKQTKANNVEPIQRDTSTAKRLDICIEQSEERLAKGKSCKKRKQERETFPNVKQTKANNVEPIQRDTSTAKRLDICIEQSEERLAKGKSCKKRKQERETFPNVKQTKANNVEPIQRDTSTAKQLDICIEQSEERLAKGKSCKKRKQERETFPNVKQTKANKKNKKQKISVNGTNGDLEQRNNDTIMKLKHKASTTHTYAHKQKHGQLNTTGDAAGSTWEAVPMHTRGAHHLAPRNVTDPLHCPSNGRISQLCKHQTQQETLDSGHSDPTQTAKKKKKRKKKKKKAD